MFDKTSAAIVYRLNTYKPWIIERISTSIIYGKTD